MRLSEDRVVDKLYPTDHTDDNTQLLAIAMISKTRDFMRTGLTWEDLFVIILQILLHGVAMEALDLQEGRRWGAA